MRPSRSLGLREALAPCSSVPPAQGSEEGPRPWRAGKTSVPVAPGWQTFSCLFQRRETEAVEGEVTWPRWLIAKGPFFLASLPSQWGGGHCKEPGRLAVPPTLRR